MATKGQRGKQGKGRGNESQGDNKEFQDSKPRNRNRKGEDQGFQAKLEQEENPKGLEEIKKTEEPTFNEKKSGGKGSKDQAYRQETNQQQDSNELKKDIHPENESKPQEISKPTADETPVKDEKPIEKEAEPIIDAEKEIIAEVIHKKEEVKAEIEQQVAKPEEKTEQKIEQVEPKTEKIETKPLEPEKHEEPKVEAFHIEVRQLPVNEAQQKEVLKQEEPIVEKVQEEEPKKIEQQEAHPIDGTEDQKQTQEAEEHHLKEDKYEEAKHSDIHNEKEDPLIQQYQFQQPTESNMIAGDENIQLYMREFNRFDINRDGTIPMSDLSLIFKSLNKDVVHLDSILAKVLPQQVEVLTISEFLSIMEEIDHVQTTRVQGQENASIQGNKILITPDEKVVEFLRVLTEYVVKAEIEGNYSEAKKARAKMEEIKIKEIIRQQNQIRIIQEEEILQVESAQKYQFAEFTRAWDSYMTEYQIAANQSLQKLKEKHALEIREFQEKLRKELAKAYKQSKQLNELRQKEQALVKMQKYSEAERTQTQADALENWERANKDRDAEDQIEKKTLGLRKQHQLALNALIKRIQKDHAQQLANRQNDSQKLQLKSRNTRTDLLNKQASESKRALESIKATLNVITSTRGINLGAEGSKISHRNSRTEESKLGHDFSGKVDTEHHNADLRQMSN